jgi:hypothetical protein
MHIGKTRLAQEGPQGGDARLQSEVHHNYLADGGMPVALIIDAASFEPDMAKSLSKPGAAAKKFQGTSLTLDATGSRLEGRLSTMRGRRFNSVRQTRASKPRDI